MWLFLVCCLYYVIVASRSSATFVQRQISLYKSQLLQTNCTTCVSHQLYYKQRWMLTLFSMINWQRWSVKLSWQHLQRLTCCGKRRKSSVLSYPTCTWHPRWGWPHRNFTKIFGNRKLQYLCYRCSIVCVILRLAFWKNSLTCDTQTERQTDGHRATAHSMPA